MDAKFLSAKEMRYNVERKKITFTWKREEEENYIHFASPSSSLQSSFFAFPYRETNTCKSQPSVLTLLHNHSLDIFRIVVDVLLLLIVVMSGKISDNFEEGAERAANYLFRGPKRCCNCWQSTRKKGKRNRRRSAILRIDNGTMCKVILLHHMSRKV